MPPTREKSELQAELDSVYLENIGEDILFLWVEKVSTLIKYLEEEKFLHKHIFSHSLMILSASLSLTQNLTRMKTFAGKRVFREAERLYRY